MVGPRLSILLEILTVIDLYQSTLRFCGQTTAQIFMLESLGVMCLSRMGGDY